MPMRQYGNENLTAKIDSAMISRTSLADQPDFFTESYEALSNSSTAKATVATAAGAVGIFALTRGRSFVPVFSEMLEKRALTELAGGIKVKTIGEGAEQRIQKIIFADGKVAERHKLGYWQEYDPKMGRNAKLNAEKEYHFEYNILPGGKLEKRTPLEIIHWHRNGKVTVGTNADRFHTSGVSANFVSNIYAEWLKMDAPLREHLIRNGAKFKMGKDLTELYPHLVNKTPRGYKPGSSWSKVDGAHSGHEAAVIERNGIARALEVFRHETGHEVDAVLGISRSPAFIEAYNLDITRQLAKGTHHTVDQYFLQNVQGSTKIGSPAGRQELTAELFNINGGGVDHYGLIENFPRSLAELRKRLEPFKQR